MKPDPQSGNGFDSLQLRHWRQFGEVDIDFHPRLTILTGANASGKTTILNILGRHFEWQGQFLTVPKWAAGGQLDWLSGSPENAIGQLSYWDGAIASLQFNVVGQAEANLSLNGQSSVNGVFISSHRTIGRYQKLATIPAEFSTVALLRQQFFQQILQRWMGSYSDKSPLTIMKESLLAAARYGVSSPDIEMDPTAAAVWSGFQDALRQTLPKSFAFLQLTVRGPEIVIVTSQGEFLIDAVSGGISAIMELTWQVYLRSWDSDSFTVCIDEPENHLHPSLQRSLIPGLLAAFPNLTFIVATHSPFIVTSAPDSHVYVLAPVSESDQLIQSSLLDTANKSATADDTLRRVLGVPVTIPIWAENEIERLVSSLDGPTFVDKVRQVQIALQRLGLEDQFPAALDALEDGEGNA